MLLCSNNPRLTATLKLNESSGKKLLSLCDNMTAVLFHAFLRALQEQCQPGEATDHKSPGSSCSITELKLPQSALITLRKVHCRAFMTSLKADEDLPAVTDGGRLRALIAGVQLESTEHSSFQGVHELPAVTTLSWKCKNVDSRTRVNSTNLKFDP